MQRRDGSRGALLILLLWAAEGHSADFRKQQLSFPSAGKDIKVELYAPKAAKKAPTILLLHGADGLEQRGEEYREVAELLAQRGFVVLIVHYFNRTDTTKADRALIDKHFLTWVGTIHESIVFARKQPGTDPQRIGLLGYSLGAYLSLSSAVLAQKDEHKVAAIVEYFGGLPSVLAWGANRLPPTLILHGEKDDVVSADEARQLERLLRAAKVPHRTMLFADEGHGFGKQAAEKAFLTLVDFFQERLKK